MIEVLEKKLVGWEFFVWGLFEFIYLGCGEFFFLRIFLVDYFSLVEFFVCLFRTFSLPLFGVCVFFFLWSCLFGLVWSWLFGWFAWGFSWFAWSLVGLYEFLVGFLDLVWVLHLFYFMQSAVEQRNAFWLCHSPVSFLERFLSS